MISKFEILNNVLFVGHEHDEYLFQKFHDLWIAFFSKNFVIAVKKWWEIFDEVK